MITNSDKKFRLKIRLKILLSISIISFLFLVIIGILLSNLITYTTQYEKMLNNITVANSVGGIIKKPLDSELWGIVSGAKNFSDGNQFKIIAKAKKTMESVKANTVTEKNIQKINTALNTLETISTKTTQLGKMIKEEKTVDENTKKLDIICDMTTLLESCISDYITAELEYSNNLKSNLQKKFKNTIIFDSGLLVLVLLFSLAFALVFSYNISKPINNLCDDVSSVGEGNLTLANVKVKTNDEVKDLVESFNLMKTNLKDIIKKVRKVSEKVNTSSQQLQNHAKDNCLAATQINEHIETLNMSILNQTNETKDTENVVKKLVDYLNIIKEDTQSITNNLNNSLKITKDGDEYINHFMNSLSNMTAGFLNITNIANELFDFSKAMTEIISEIHRISKQTKLLSTNIRIEAARNGSYGHGFDVVALEVSKLSSETQSSTNKISSIVTKVQHYSEQINMLMVQNMDVVNASNDNANILVNYFNMIGESNNTVNKDVNNILEYLKTISNEVEAINEKAEFIEKLSCQNSESIVRVLATVQEQSVSSEEVADSASNLFDLAEEMKLSTNKFILDNN